MKKRDILTLLAMTAMIMVVGCDGRTADENSTDITMEQPKIAVVEPESVSADAETLLGPCTTEEWEERKADCMEQARYGDVLDTRWWNMPLDPQIIIEDVVSGQREYQEHYYTVDNKGWIYVDVFYGGTEIRRCIYYPGAVLDGESWSAYSLLKDYNNHVSPWKEMDSYAKEAWLYTSDYRTCFRVYDGWMYANGAKIQPVYDCLISVEDPKALLWDYQHGLWDETKPVYSIDYGTMVEVVYNGDLMYTYCEAKYSKEYDIKQLAYKGYSDPPEFLMTGVNDDYNVTALSSYEYDYDDGCTGRVFRAEVEVYIDLPDGSKDGFEDAIGFYYADPGVGMYVIMPDRIELYRRGVLLDTWCCNIDERNYRMIYPAFGDETHVAISAEEIVRLLPDGKIEVVIDDIIGAYGINDWTSLMELSLKNGVLTGYSQHYGLVEIAEDIDTINHTWNVLLMTGKDGMCYAVDSKDFACMEDDARALIEAGAKVADLTNELVPVCLGDRTWEHYLDLHRAGLLEMPVME